METGEILFEQGKNKKDRIVVMSDDMSRLMKKYSMYTAFYKRSQYELFFADQYGNPYTTFWLRTILNECFQKANLNIRQGKGYLASIAEID